MNPIARVAITCLVLLQFVGSNGQGAELAMLDQQNWDTTAPKGKEVDAIYGDHVLRNDEIVAVVAQAVGTRNANMTVRGVGGALIDLTLRNVPNDQLSAFYPHAAAGALHGPIEWHEAFGTTEGLPATAERSARLAFRLEPAAEQDSDEADTLPPALQIAVGYQLNDGDRYLTVVSKITNTGTEPVEVPLQDGIRADGEFRFGFDSSLDLWWAEDRFWKQAYGVQPVGNDYSAVERWTERPRDPRMVRYLSAGGGPVVVPPGATFVLTRRVTPAVNSIALQSLVRQNRDAQLAPVVLEIRDPRGPVAEAEVEFRQVGSEATYGHAQTDSEGRVATGVPAGNYQVRVRSHGRSAIENLEVAATGPQPLRRRVELPPTGFLSAQVDDGDGRPLACRVVFRGVNGTETPNFGPKSAISGVRNLQYTPNGRFSVALPPGRYEAIVSHGPEYDAVVQPLEVRAGETVALRAVLVRTVDTRGWLSADFHSHSSPSGDNTASQRGRVLNLLAEHIEFAPCTEHNRISTYVPHLQFFDALQRMATCTGMELTGSPLPLNHQNAFPLIHHEHTQDGGGPTAHHDPAVQIERLAMWDDGSDKFVQANHPNIIQMLGDRDQDGKADGGFERMFHFMDAIEVHPQGEIFNTQEQLYRNNDAYGNRMFNWLQLLNLGYRVPGVVNTDAHWNYYGSGGLRNYIRSSTDDPGQANIAELVRAAELGQMVMTNGPFLTVEARTAAAEKRPAGPGDDLAAPGGRLVVRVRVQCANWLQVNRVQLFLNGRPLEELNFTRRQNNAMFGTGPVVFDHELPVALTADAHVVVAVIGEDAPMGAVYAPEPDDGEDGAPTLPVAVANPIFVDIDGDGFEPNGDMLGLPLPVQPGHRPTHGHDHANFHRQAPARQPATAE